MMKYLPDAFKARPKVGGPKMRADSVMEDFSEDSVAHRATDESYLAQLVHLSTTKRILEVKNYRNTDFVQLVLLKGFFSRIEKLALRIGTTPETIMTKALISTVVELERITRDNKAIRPGHAFSARQTVHR